jgi:hypothetical protein
MGGFFMGDYHNDCCEPKECCTRPQTCCCQDNCNSNDSGIGMLILILVLLFLFCGDNNKGGLFGGLF